MSARIRSGPRRMLAFVAALACGAVIMLPRPVMTDAAFTDTEQATTTVTGFKLGPPQIQTTPVCAHPLTGLLGGVVLEMKWKWPATTPPYGDDVKTVSTWTVGGVSADGKSGLTTSKSGNVYTTSLTHGLIDGLLGGLSALLGGTYTVTVATKWTTPGNVVWASQAVSTVKVTYPALGLGQTTCVITNGS